MSGSCCKVHVAPPSVLCTAWPSPTASHTLGVGHDTEPRVLTGAGYDAVVCHGEEVPVSAPEGGEARRAVPATMDSTAAMRAPATIHRCRAWPAAGTSRAHCELPPHAPHPRPAGPRHEASTAVDERYSGVVDGHNWPLLRGDQGRDKGKGRWSGPASIR